MTDFEKIWSFQNLYQAHRKARLGKRNTAEVIDFELRLGENLQCLSMALKSGNYHLSGYYTFMVHDPKDRVIHALHYRDRVVQHCICDEVLGPVLEKRLIYDNAACRVGKGTLFAQKRVTGFIREYYSRYGTGGYVLKYDIRKYFDHIDHSVLKEKLKRAIRDPDVLKLLDGIIDSYEAEPGKGLPLGNQTSQWFAIYYLDGLDRLIKEKEQIRYYSRYMDDGILIDPDKEKLKHCRREMENYAREQLGLSFNSKTQIFPLKNGFEYLGFHFYLTESGKIVRKLKQGTKRKYTRKLTRLSLLYSEGQISLSDVHQVVQSYHAHFSHGHVWRLEHKQLGGFCLRKISQESGFSECPQIPLRQGKIQLN